MLRLAGAALVSALLLTGCTPKDDRLETLSAGIREDSLLKLMKTEAPERKDAWLLDAARIEAWYFPYRKATDTMSFKDRNMSPVVLVDSVVVAWGWDKWDSIASAKHIPVAPPK
jgi:broad specificity phosphatase PhoE